jgi:hypothetical protein
MFIKSGLILQGGGWAYKSDAAACHDLRAAMTTEPCTGSGGPPLNAGSHIRFMHFCVRLAWALPLII